ncbi:hypothetical protein MMPV_007482 [Pyropia vietnamensis]
MASSPLDNSVDERPVDALPSSGAMQLGTGRKRPRSSSPPLSPSSAVAAPGLMAKRGPITTVDSDRVVATRLPEATAVLASSSTVLPSSGPSAPLRCASRGTATPSSVSVIAAAPSTTAGTSTTTAAAAIPSPQAAIAAAAAASASMWAGDGMRGYMRAKAVKQDARLRAEFPSACAPSPAGAAGVATRRALGSATARGVDGGDGGGDGTRAAAGGRPFAGLVIWVNGQTRPGRQEVRAAVAAGGGTFAASPRAGITHEVADRVSAATAAARGNPGGGGGGRGGRGRRHLVTAAWVTACVAAGRRVAEAGYVPVGAATPGGGHPRLSWGGGGGGAPR